MSSPAANDSATNNRTGAAGNGTSERTPLLRRHEADGEDSPRAAGGRQRWLAFGVALVLMSIVIVLIVIFAIARPAKPVSARELCLTPACVHAASEILYNLDPNYKEIDACTNFDQMVCGGWESRHDMRPDQSKINTFSIMAEEGQSILRHILEGPYPDASDHSFYSPMQLTMAMSNTDEDNFNELQRAYKACMATDVIEKQGIAPLKSLLGDLAKSFSLTNELSASSKKNNLSEIILTLERRGISSFLELGANADDKSPDEMVVVAFPRFSIGLPAKDYYQDADTVAQYQEAMSQVLAAVLPSHTAKASSTDKLAAGIVQLEQKLASVTPDLEDLQDAAQAYNPMSLKDTVALAPELGLDHVLMSLAPADFTIDRVITAFPTYLSNVSAIVRTTPAETLQAFFSWKAIQAYASAIIAPEIKPYTRFMNKLRGQDPDATSERYRVCIGHVDDGLGWILSRFYIEVAFSAQAKAEGNQIISDIKEQFISRIKTLDWMDDEVKDQAIAKVRAIDQKIGYPTMSPNITDPESLKSYYSELKIDDSYFDNAVAMTQFAVRENWAQLGKPTDRNRWLMTANTVNAYYNPAGNEIVFPAGIMQFPVFGGDLPSYINYGAFGAVAGHELSHAFDNNGRHYDVSGKLADWWTNATIQGFLDLADCFVEEYSNFTVPNPDPKSPPLHVNGRQTLGENIADAGGLAAAYNSWQDRRKQQGRSADADADLPVLADYFSQEQLFFVAYGSFWCSKYSPNALAQTVYTDVHSPNMLRIRGAATMNTRAFREAFSCAEKEPVCELW